MKFKHEVGDEVQAHRILKVKDAYKTAYSKQKGKDVRFYNPRVTVKCCNCGYEKTVNGSQVKYLSCGHGPCHQCFVDMAGQRFGKLLVKEYVYTGNNDRAWKWKCICDCGAEELASRGTLLAGKVCCLKCRYTDRPGIKTLPEHEAALNRLESQYKRSAGNRGYPWKLTSKQFRALVTQNCRYCGEPPGVRGGMSVKANGVDRVDNSKGYTIKNCVPCCKVCNRMKRKMACDSFIEHVRNIVNYYDAQSSTTMAQASTPKRVETERTPPVRN